MSLVALCAAVALAAAPWIRPRGRRAPKEPAEVRTPASPTAGVDVTTVLVLLDVAIGSGAALPRALGVVGEAIGGVDGDTLRRVGRVLVLGAPWQEAWPDDASGRRLLPVQLALRSCWEHGAAPGPALRASVERLRRGTAARARQAAGRLGVQLVLPVGTCLLPAFVLVGLVPVLVSLGAGLLGG